MGIVQRGGWGKVTHSKNIKVCKAVVSNPSEYEIMGNYHKLALKNNQ